MKGHKDHHHKHAKGGRTSMVASGNPDVIKEAEEKKHGGRAKHKRASGGKVGKASTALGLMTGGAVRPRLDRPGRKMGGRVGADRSPLSSAHSATSAEKTPASNGGN